MSNSQNIIKSPVDGWKVSGKRDSSATHVSSSQKEAIDGSKGISIQDTDSPVDNNSNIKAHNTHNHKPKSKR